MDPLSLSASIAGLISITDMIAGRSYKYIKEARGASKEVQKLLEEITDLFGVLNSLRLVASRYQDEVFDSTMQSQHIYTCHMLLEKIKVRLDKADPSQVDESKSQFRQKASSLGRTLIWPFSSAETKGLISEVANQKATLSLALAADGMNALIESLSQQKAQREDITEIRDNIRTQMAEQAMSLLSDERRKILNTIGPFDPSGHQNVAIKLRQPGTGVWFTEGPQFKRWLETPRSKLWLYGIPGAGKTVLTSSIVQATMNQSESADGIAYFYCDYKDSRTQEPLIILGALIRQLAIQNSRSFEALEKFYSIYYPESGSRTGMTMTPEDLCLLIQTMSGFFDEVMIIVDALDECINDRSNIVELLASLNANDSNIKTLFTSRLETDIELHLYSYEKISIAATSSDLKLYVASEIESRSRRKLLRTRDPDLKKEIMDRLVDGAEGMFRWVTCQLDYLCELNTDKAIRKALNSLPPTLFATYERILDRVNSSNADTQLLVQRVLTWIVCSTIPLSTNELLEALSITEGDTEMDLDARPDEVGILKWCSSLVRRTPDGERLELAHFTVKEFLLATDPSELNSPYARYKINFADQDLPLAKLCLTYLLFDDFRDIKLVEQDIDAPDVFLDEYSFYHYAASYWPQHAFFHREDADLLELIQILFDPSKTGNFICWSHCWRRWTIVVSATDDEISDTETLHFAASLLLHDICQWLIEDKGRLFDLNKVSTIGTPLYCALTANESLHLPKSVSNHDVRERDNATTYGESKRRTLEYLLDAGASMDSRVCPGDDRSLLALALKKDFGWRSLLSRGVILDDSTLEIVERLRRDRRPLGEQFLSEVSDQNLDQNIRSKYVTLALQMDLSREHAVTMMAKAKCADDFSAEGSSALTKAAESGQFGVVRELLNKPEVDIDFPIPTNGRTALHEACRNGHLQIVELLVEHNASLEVNDNLGMTPLLDAAVAGNLNVFNFLEDSGSNVNAVARDGSTVLHVVAASNSIFILDHVVVSLKLTHTLSTRMQNGKTALLRAVEAGSLDTARSILQKSSRSEVLSRTDDGYTCLHYAVLSRNPRMISLFQDSGICHHDQTSEGLTALHYAAMARSEKIFHTMMQYIDRALLLPQDIMALPTFIDTGTCLQYPDGTWGIDDFISGRRLDLPTKAGKTALQLLVSSTHFRYGPASPIDDLISRGGIDLERRDGEKRTPLIILAARFASAGDITCREALRHLIDGGVDFNAQDIMGRTALHYLCDSTIFSPEIYKIIIHLLGIEELLLDTFNIGVPPLLREPSITDLIPPLIPSYPHGPPNLSSRRLNSARVDIRDINGETALQAFFRNISRARSVSYATDLAIALLSLTTKVELDRPWPDGSRLIGLAIDMGNDRLIKELYRLGVDTQTRYGTPNMQSPLEQFCIRGVRDPEILKKLIKDCKDLTERNTQGMGLLHLACSSGHLRVVKELVDGGFDINLRCSKGGTPLSVAVAGGHTPIVEYLLDCGARTDGCGSGHQHWITSLVSSITNVSICKLLEDRGINNWSERTRSYFFTKFIPGFTTTKAGPTKDNLWISRTIHRLTPFHYFALRGYIDVFEYITSRDKEVDIDTEAEFGIRPLFFAILGGKLSVVEFLLRQGADPNGVFKSTGWTMLHLASHLGIWDIFKVLLENGANPWAKDKAGLTPRIVAVHQGHSDIVDELEEAEKLCLLDKAEKFTEAQDDKISPALSDAIAKGDLSLCQTLIRLGFSIDGTCECGCTPLLKACLPYKKEIVWYLLSKGASTDGVACSREASVSGFSLLQLAALFGELELFQAVLKQSSTSTLSAVRPIHIAAREGRLNILKFLVESAEDKKLLLQAKTPKETDYSGSEAFGKFLEYSGQASPLHIAVKFGRVEAAAYLLRAGADLEARDQSGQTAMHILVLGWYSKEMFELLLKSGARLNVRDNEGTTILMVAAELGKVELVKDLIALVPEGLDVHATDIEGRTALHYAIDSPELDIAKPLVEAGLSATKLDLMEISPIARALYKELEPFPIELPKVDTLRSRIHGSHLNIASFVGYELVVTELLERASAHDSHDYVNLPCQVGTPLYVSASRGQIPIMEKLLQKGADINLVGGPTGTPLMGACAMGKIEAVKFLLRQGAELQCTKLNGAIITAEEAAKQHEDVLSVLQKFKNKGTGALNDDIPIKTADITKLDEFMVGYRERKEKEAKEDNGKDKSPEGKKNESKDDTINEITTNDENIDRVSKSSNSES